MINLLRNTLKNQLTVVSVLALPFQSIHVLSLAFQLALILIYLLLLILLNLVLTLDLISNQTASSRS